MARPIQPLPPERDASGRDSYPFAVLHGHWREPVSRWYDALIEASAHGISSFVSVEGYHPSHTMEPFGSGVACTVCGSVDSTQGGIMPCEYDLRGRTPLEAAKDERALAEVALAAGASVPSG